MIVFKETITSIIVTFLTFISVLVGIINSLHDRNMKSGKGIVSKLEFEKEEYRKRCYYYLAACVILYAIHCVILAYNMFKGMKINELLIFTYAVFEIAALFIQMYVIGHFCKCRLMIVGMLGTIKWFLTGLIVAFTGMAIQGLILFWLSMHKPDFIKMNGMVFE